LFQYFERNYDIFEPGLFLKKFFGLLGGRPDMFQGKVFCYPENIVLLSFDIKDTL
jgi:hypothetical protein